MSADPTMTSQADVPDVEALEPCPFCGASISVSPEDPSPHGAAGYHYHPNNDCWLAGSMIAGEWIPSAAWNRRASLSSRVEQARKQAIEECARVLEEERQGYENLTHSTDSYTRMRGVSKEAALHKAINIIRSLSLPLKG